MSAATRLDEMAKQTAATLSSPHALKLIRDAVEFNGTEKAATFVRVLLARGIDPAGVTESNEYVHVSYDVENRDGDGFVIMKSVSVPGHYRKDRYLVFYGPVAVFDHKAATELGVDLLRALAVH